MNENVPLRASESYNYFINDTRTGSFNYSKTLLITLGYNYRSGTALPEWKLKIAKGQDASTAYSRTLYIINKGARVYASCYLMPSYAQQARYNLTSGGLFRLVGQPVVSYTTDTETRNRALARIKTQLNERSGAKRLMAPLAELRELRGLIRKSASFTRDFLQTTQSLLEKRGKDFLKGASDHWLHYNFGIAPTVSDTIETVAAIKAYIEREDLSIRLRSSATKSGIYSYPPPTSISDAPFGATWKNTGSASYTLKYTYIGAFDLFLKASNDYSMSDHFGLTLQEVPAALWALTTLSWVVDYFTNVGEFLEDAFWSLPGQTRYLVECRKYEMNWEHTFYCYWQDPGSSKLIVRPGADKSSGKVIQFTRTPLAALPHAGLTIKSLDSIGKGGIVKIINLATVLLQRLS